MNLVNRIVRLEQTSDKNTIVPKWALQAALADRDSSLSDWALRVRMIEGRNRVAAMRGQEVEAIPERPVFDELDAEAARIYAIFGNEADYLASLPGPVILSDEIRAARERRA